MSEPTLDEIIIKGLNASPGICIGKAYIVDQEGVDVVVDGKNGIFLSTPPGLTLFAKAKDFKAYRRLILGCELMFHLLPGEISFS